MSARFRIRTKEGQELSFASHEIFAEFVRSGDVSPDDVVYDAETREWSSAQTHPVVLQIQLEAEEVAGAEEGAEAEQSRDAPGPADTADGDEIEEGLEGSASEADVESVEENAVAEIDLDLAPAPAGLSPHEQAAAFVAKMEAERASEQIFDPDLGLKMERGSSSVLEELVPPVADAPPKPQSTPQEERSRSRREPLMAPERPEGRRAPARERPTAVPARAGGKPARRGAARRFALFAILAAAAAAAGVYFAPDLLGPTTGEGNELETGAAFEPSPTPEIASTEEAVRARARERFLTSTQVAMRGLEQIPDAWLRGSYLAAPSDYPRVPEVWERYVTTIRDVRARDDERYREAYLRALDDARVVEGGARTLRLSGALTAFRSDAARREAHYDRVEALALTSIRGHDALVQAEGTIMYQPATGPALSADPVIEAVGRSAEAQRLLNQVLDAILALLHAEGGPGEASNIREWVWDGLLDAVTG